MKEGEEVNITEKLITHHFHVNSIEQNEDNTVIKFKAIVHDFLPTVNGWAITEDTASKRIHTLINKHIVTRYYSADENGGIDCLGDHEPSSTILRGTDDIEIPKMLTNSIGTITNAYIDWIDSENQSLGKAVWAEGVLLAMENINEIGLLLEWFEKDIKILISVEWWYTTSITDINNVIWIADPTYSNICILNSEQRGDKPIIYGNYDYANLQLQFNQAIKADLDSKSSLEIDKQNNNKGSDNLENIFIKALNDISFGEIRNKIYSALAKVMVAEEYNSMWLSDWDIYETYFIYETYSGTEWVRYKIDYTKSENDELTVDYESKKQVVRQDVYVEVSEVQALNTKIDELKNDLNSKTEELTNVVSEKGKLDETIISLNSTIEELKPFKDEIDKQKYEVSLNEKQTYYSEKFNAMNAKEKFESEEVQGLIKQTLNPEENVQAELTLNKMLVDMLQVKKEVNSKETNLQNDFKELNSKMNNLIPTNDDNFVGNYGFEVN